MPGTLARQAGPGELQALAGELIRTPQALAERVRAIQEVAHVLSPAAAVSALPPHIAINPVVVPIDPTTDPKTGRGPDCYFQSSIHKSRKVNGERGGRDEWVPEEVSLNKQGLLKLLAAAGVNITRSVQTDDRTQPHYWSWCAEGTITEFDGSIRRLPPGNVEVDLRDGSAQIGEWNPDDWAQNLERAEAERKQRRLPADEAWRVKVEPIGGWTGERVIQARRFGLRLAESKALNALARNLGLKQSYSIEELRAKPFVIFRASFMPDMSDPRVREIVTAAHLGALDLMYPVGSTAALPASSQSSSVIDTQATAADDDEADPTSAAAPDGAIDFDELEKPKPSEPVAQIFTPTRVSQSKVLGDDWYFIETKEARTFATRDLETAKAFNAARKDAGRMAVDGAPFTLDGKTYYSVDNAQPAGKPLPNPKDL